MIPQPVPPPVAQVGFGVVRRAATRRGSGGTRGRRWSRRARRACCTPRCRARSPRRRRCCRSRPRRWRRRAAGRRAPASSTSRSIRSVSRHTIASTSAAAATSSSWVKRRVVVACDDLVTGVDERFEPAVGEAAGDEDSGSTALSGSCSRPGRRPPTPDREAEAVDRRVVAHRPQAVHQVRRDVHEVALRDLALLAVDHHDPAARGDVIELVRRVRVRVDQAAARDLELAHQLEEAAVGDVLHLARVDEPPHRDGAVVLDDRRHLLDRPHVHRTSFLTLASLIETDVDRQRRHRVERDVGRAARVVDHRRAPHASAWAPFGWLPVADTDPRDADRRPRVRVGRPPRERHRARADEVEHTDHGLVCAVLYRHDTHTQTLMPLERAPRSWRSRPAIVDFSRPEHLDAVRAFRARAARRARCSPGAPGTGDRSRSSTSPACTCSTCRGGATPRTTRACLAVRATVRVAAVGRRRSDLEPAGSAAGSGGGPGWRRSW